MMMVLMVQVGRVGVRVDYRFVPVPVAVRFIGGIAGTVRVLVVFIMEVQMFVRRRFMDVPVFMMFGQVQPHPGCHQSQGWPDRNGGVSRRSAKERAAPRNGAVEK
jgi:hypothetical protein